MSPIVGTEDQDVRTPLKILMLEDVAEEAEVLQRELRKAGLQFTAERVQSKTRFIEALGRFAPDLILADSRLPTFDGRSALEIVRQGYPDLPVIMVTGALGDEAAVELLIAGASDYVLKDRLARLAPAVRRALGEAAMKRARRAADERIRRLTRVLQMLSGINTAVLRIRDTAALLEEACRLAHRVGNYSFAFVAMVDPNARCARPAAWAGHGAERQTQVSFPISEQPEGDSSVTGRVLRTGETIVCNDITTYVGTVASDELIGGAGRHSLASLPLLIDGTPVGAFTVAAAEHDAISREELDLLQEMVANLAFALQYLQKENTVRYLSYFDPLTGLAKRRLFCERLTRILGRLAGSRSEPIVAAVKLASLNVINDSFGRYTGDLLLQCVAERLKEEFADSEHVAHLGGGAFAVLILQGVSNAGAPQEQIFRLFEQPFAVAGRDIPVAVKCGLARFRVDGSDAETLVDNAEAALHATRDVGVSYLYYSAEMSSGMAERLELEHRLRGALERNEFVLYYQPQIHNVSGSIVGAEALLRWRDPERGSLPPAAFLPMLESTGLIVSVGEWVVRQAAADCRHWRDIGMPLRVAVNVSTVELSHAGFAARFLRTAGVHASAVSDLHVEITEGILLDDPEFVTDTLQQLRAHGVRVAIDDFGIGHSSLSRLSQLPIDVLKVDRSFTSRLTHDTTSQAVVSTIIALARTYQLGTIAEGVETREQSEILTALGCEQSQGYLYGEPVPAAALEARLKASRP